jgi:hypothetical protein
MCKRLLDDSRQKTSINNKIIKILKNGNSLKENQDKLYTTLSENKVCYADASSCKKLFIMFLESSGNKLLAKLLGAQIHRGRNATEVAVEEFKSIW